MEIRRSNRKDLKEISNIFRVESSKKPYFQKWPQRKALKKITNSFNKDDIYVYIADKKIIGFIICQKNTEKNEIYIDEFWLKSNYQGRGIGKKIMKYIEDDYKKKGFNTINFMANKKAKAVGFYKKLNYKIKHEFFYMTKKLK